MWDKLTRLVKNRDSLFYLRNLFFHIAKEEGVILEILGTFDIDVLEGLPLNILWETLRIESNSVWRSLLTIGIYGVLFSTHWFIVFYDAGMSFVPLESLFVDLVAISKVGARYVARLADLAISFQNVLIATAFLPLDNLSR